MTAIVPPSLPGGSRALVSGVAEVALALAALAFAPAEQASFPPPELMDEAAIGMAWSILIVVPIAGIVLFWMVHALPEKIAHKRYDPQTDAVRTLCLPWAPGCGRT